MTSMSATSSAAGVQFASWAPLRSNEHRHGYERQIIGQARRRVSTTQEAIDKGSACAVVWRE